ncbi:MAG: HlyC/CorC family transporter [Mycobacteriaceae bacterium]|nr:HlyC/CorC family transporter [Mycobacteriaceae bacterium]
MQILLTVVSLVGFVALTAATAVFVAGEFSLTALERSTVDAHARSGDLRARLVQRAHRSLSFQLSGAQVGITLTTLVTGFIAEPVLARLFSPPLARLGLSAGAADQVALVLALVMATSLSMVYGELVPKNIAIARPLPTARFTAGPLTAFSAAFAWSITLLNQTANAIVRRFGVEPAEELRSARSPQELGSLVRSSAERGALDERTAVLMDRSLQFGSRSAEEFMTPRVKIHALEISDTIADLIDAAASTGLSRFPVVDGDLDNTVGIVHIKQAFAYPSVESRRAVRLDSVVRPVAVVPASLDGDEVLEVVRADGGQVALVVDEYGGTAGMVTMEDLIEEIVGDVRDEHDQPDLDVRRVDAGWVCSGLLRIDEVQQATGYRGPDGDYETIAGLVMTELGRIPQAGDQVFLPPNTAVGDSDVTWLAEVLAMDGRRIDRIELTPLGKGQAA